MNLKAIPDTNLIQITETLAREERELLTKVLHHLREIERRRLYSSLGYKSLFEFTSKHLGYPEDQAYRRISAMRLLNEIPEIEGKIVKGEISLTHIGLAQTLFRQEKKIHQQEMPVEQKRSVLMRIANKPVREAERLTLSMGSQPQSARPDRMTLVTESLVEIKFSAPSEVWQKIEKLKGFLAHTHPNISVGELFDRLCNLGLAEWDPTKIAAPRKRRVKPQTGTEKSSKVSLAQLRRNVFQRAQSQCENCKSTYALEIDHIVPQAMGGSSALSNLRVLCRSCNQRAAIEQFGIEKMNPFIN